MQNSWRKRWLRNFRRWISSMQTRIGPRPK